MEFRPKSPCVKDCEFRSSDCKAQCEKLKEYEKKYAEFIDKKNEVSSKRADFNYYKGRVIAKTNKRCKK